jgi:hypothetical protein
VRDAAPALGQPRVRLRRAVAAGDPVFRVDPELLMQSVQQVKQAAIHLNDFVIVMVAQQMIELLTGRRPVVTVPPIGDFEILATAHVHHGQSSLGRRRRGRRIRYECQGRKACQAEEKTASTRTRVQDVAWIHGRFSVSPVCSCVGSRM